MRPTLRCGVLCLALTATLATACSGASSGSTAQRGPASHPAPTASTTPASTSSAPLPTFDACDVLSPAVFARFADLPGRLTGDTSGASSASSTCTYRLSGVEAGSMTVAVNELARTVIAADLTRGATRVTGLGDEATAFALGARPIGDAEAATRSSVMARRGQRLVSADCPMPLAECRSLVAYVLSGRRSAVPRRTTLNVPTGACSSVEQVLGPAFTAAVRATDQPTDASAKLLSRHATRLRATPRSAPGAAAARSLAASLDILTYYADVSWPLHHTPLAERQHVTAQLLDSWYEDVLGPMRRTCGTSWLHG